MVARGDRLSGDSIGTLGCLVPPRGDWMTMGESIADESNGDSVTEARRVQRQKGASRQWGGGWREREREST